MDRERFESETSGKSQSSHTCNFLAQERSRRMEPRSPGRSYINQERRGSYLLLGLRLIFRYRPQESSVREESVPLRGTSFADATGSSNDQIKILDINADDPHSRSSRRNDERHSRPMWDSVVAVTGVRTGRQILLQDIRKAPQTEFDETPNSIIVFGSIYDHARVKPKAVSGKLLIS